MSTTFVKTATTASQQERRAKPKQARTEIWTSLLRQTQVAQSRNRSNAVAQRHLIVCGGSPDDQRNLLSSLARPPPPQPLKRNRGDEQRSKGSLVLSNRYAYGYGHVTLFSADQGGLGGVNLGSESEEVARLECHCVPEPEGAYEGVLRRLLNSEPEKDATEDSRGDQDIQRDGAAEKSIPTVAILLSWKEPWKFLSKLRAWFQLLARSLIPPSSPPDEDPTEVLKEHDIFIVVIVQNVEAQETLERDGWAEETFDYVCQVLRTAILPLHPRSALLFMPSSTLPQQPSSPLTESQKVVYSALNLDLASLAPRASSTTSTSGPKKEELAPHHNVVDRMNIVVPTSWDSVGKIRLLSENFSPEEVLSAWSTDLLQPVFLPSPTNQLDTASTDVDASDAKVQAQHKRQDEEVFAVEPTSPVASSPELPPSPSKMAASAIRSYEMQIVDPNAHKVPKAPNITVNTRPDQDFLKEMKSELDVLATKDRERSSTSSSPTTAGRIAGEGTGALNGLGDVSFNVGGVSYNTVSAEAAIERLKRPQASGTLDSPSPSATAGASSSPLATSSRAGTPRPPRRERDHGDRDREGTPSVASPLGTGKSDFPSEDLEKYFASLAKKAGGGTDSRSGTPSRH